MRLVSLLVALELALAVTVLLLPARRDGSVLEDADAPAAGKGAWPRWRRGGQGLPDLDIGLLLT